MPANFNLSNAGGIYRVDYPEHGVSFCMEALEESHHELRGLATVLLEVEGVHKTLMGETSVNLRSDVIRKRIGKVLHEDWSTIDIDTWHMLVKQACNVVVAAYRQGEPPKRVAEICLREGVPYRAWPLMRELDPNILFGFGGSLKSMIAQWIAVEIDQYRIDGLFRCEPGNVLYLDYETNEDAFRRRIDAIHAGMGIDEAESGIVYRFTYHPVAKDVTQLQRIIVEHKIDVVIVDSAGPACGGALEDPQAVLHMFTALRSLKRTVLLVAHQAKHDKGEAATRTPFGSVYFVNAARNIWMAQKQQEQGEDTAVVALSHTKTNVGRHEKSFALKMRYEESNVPETGDRLILQRTDLVREAPELAKGIASIRDLLREQLRTGRKTTAQLSEATGKDEGVIRTVLNRYRDKEYQRFHDDGSWGLMAWEGERNSVT